MSAGDLEQGRAAYAGRAWRSAFESLSRADEDGPLEVEDVERLAISAYLLGRDDVSAVFLERAHNLHADSGELLQAVTVTSRPAPVGASSASGSSSR